MFASKEGGFLRYDNFRRGEWKAAVEASGLGDPLGFHSLRHTAATLLINSGVDPIQVQRRLGHADVRITLGAYGHLFAHREDDINRRLEKVHSQAVKKAVAASSRPAVVDLDELRATKGRSTRGMRWTRGCVIPALSGHG
jgi:site-specific recombinase XerD